MKKLALLSVLFCAVLSFGQTLIPSTGLAAALPSSSQFVQLYSTSGISAGNLLYVDSEAMLVNTVRGDGLLIVQRGQAGTRPGLHAVGTQVWYGPPNYFKAADQLGYPAGACSGREIVLPNINLLTGVITDCTRGMWVRRVPLSQTTTLGSKLRRLELAAQQSNPLTALPLIIPPAWQASTAYLGSSEVSNGGNLYALGVNLSGTQTCTSAASGGPTGTSAALITDNTCSWYFDGVLNQTASSPAAPTITQLANAAPPSPYTNTFGLTTLGLNWVVSGATVLSGTNCSFSLSFQGCFKAHNISPTVVLPCNENGNGCNADTATVEFWSDAPIGYFNLYGNSDDCSIWVDGSPVALKVYWQTTASFQDWIIWDFSTAGGRKPRHFRFICSGTFMGASTGTGNGTQIAVTPVDSVWAPNTADDVSFAWVSDSYGQVGGLKTPGYSIAYNVGNSLGWDNILVDTVGGTGWVLANGIQNYPSRIVTDVCPFNYDVVGIWGGLNDPGTTDPNLPEQAAVLATLQTLRACLPKALIVAFGVPTPSADNAGINLTQEIGKEHGIQNAVIQMNDPLVFFVPVSTDPAGRWFTGSGNVGAPANNGNNDVIISADGTHPTFVANKNYMTMKIVKAMHDIIAQVP